MGRVIEMRRSVLIGLGLGVFLLAGASAQELQWFKGNTHTHSLWSDGNDFPEMIADWYKKEGYDFLGISDHNILQRGEKAQSEKTISKRQRGIGRSAIEKYRARFGDDWIETRKVKEETYYVLKTLEEYRPLFEEEGKFLLLEAEEISNPKTVHINAINLGELIPPAKGADVREIMRASFAAVNEQEKRLGRPMMAHLNHPNFQMAISAEDIAHVIEEQFFEVYNGHPGINHMGYSGSPTDEQIWDIANTLRIAKLDAAPLYGVATDDSHTYHGGDVKPGRGWVMVRASELSADALVVAMKAGEFYGSSGVALEEIVFDAKKGELRIRIAADGDATFTTEIIGTEKGYDEAVEEIPASEKYPKAVRYRYSEDVGKTLATIEGREVVYTLTGKELYVRATITSSQRPPSPSFEGQYEQAWTQPVGWRGRDK